MLKNDVLWRTRDDIKTLWHPNTSQTVNLVSKVWTVYDLRSTKEAVDQTSSGTAGLYEPVGQISAETDYSRRLYSR